MGPHLTQNPVVELTIVDENGTHKTAAVKTTGRKNCNSPVYQSYFEFEAGNAMYAPHPADQLQIKLLFDTSLHVTRKFLRTATVPLSSLKYSNFGSFFGGIFGPFFLPISPVRFAAPHTPSHTPSHTPAR